MGNATGTVRYTRTVARATLSMPWLWRILGLENPETDVERISVTIFAQAVTQNWRNLCPGGWQLSHGSGLLMRATARAGIDRVCAKCFLNANWNRRTAVRSNPSSFVSQ